MPESRIDSGWPFPQRLPLAAAWSGTCAAAAQASRPTGEELKSCNIGYARGCARLPAERKADAVRFALGGERDGLIQIRYSLERDYLPATHGEMSYAAESGRWIEMHADACVQKMAECYLQVQLERRAKS
jgi:hypothetical protein